MSSLSVSSSLLLSGVSLSSVSSSSVSNQSCSEVLQVPISASKRSRTSNSHSASIPHTSYTSYLMRLPVVLFSEVFSYLFLDERMAAQRVCSPINNHIIFHANTHYLLSKEFPMLDQAALGRCFKKSILNTIKVIDLKGVASDSIFPLLSEKMPALKRLVLSNLMDEVEGEEGKEEGVATILTANCSNLRSLDLRGCEREGNALLKMSLSNLTYLNLAGCTNITSQDLQVLFERSPYLEELFLDRCNNITTEDVVALSKKLTRLRKLSLNGCTHITSEAVASLSNCSHLQELHLANCTGLTNNIVSGLILRELKTLDLSCNYNDNLHLSLQDSIALLSENCPKLERLLIKDRCYFDLSLLKLPELVELNLKNFFFQGEFEKMFAGLAVGCPKLTSLDLSNFDHRGNYRFDLSLISFPLLKSLDISGWGGPKCHRKEWGKDMLLFTSQCPMLESLNLSSHDFLPSEFLPTFCFLKNLKKLDLSDSRFNDNDFFDLVEACPQLESLKLYNGKFDTDYDEQQLEIIKFTGKAFNFCSLLELVYLDISNCRYISNEAIQYISSSFPKLKYLSLYQHSVDSKLSTIALMLLNLPELTHLNYAGLEEYELKIFKTLELTRLKNKNFQIFANPIEEALKAVKANCPKLKYLISNKDELAYWDNNKDRWRDLDSI